MVLGSEQSRSLLIVDSDDLYRTRLGREVTASGFDVITASSFSWARELFAKFLPDFVVLDIRLSEGNGLDLAAEFLWQRPSCRIVVLTSYGSLKTAVCATKLGVVDYLIKPSHRDEVIDALFAEPGCQAAPPETPCEDGIVREEVVRIILQETGWNVSKAARMLNLPRKSLQRIIARTGIQRPSATGEQEKVAS